MKIYLDMCVYNRPFDDQSQPRIMFESQCFVIIIAHASSGSLKILNSFALEYENSRNSKSDNMILINDMLKKASEYISYTDDIQKRAEHHEKYGITALDAIHLACAESANADYFLTCDDKFSSKKPEKLKG